MEVEERKEMTLFEHLDELRTRIIIVIVSIAVCSGAGWFIGPFVLDFLIQHAGVVQALSPVDPFMIRLKMSLMVGVMLASPMIILQIWLFVAPGLYANEKRFTLPAVIFGTILFFVGGTFGAFILPFTLKFLGKFATEYMKIEYSLTIFVSFCTTFILAFAIVFELPIVLIILAKIGIVNYRMLAANRKYAIMIGLIVGAILTPADVASMLFLAGPLYCLFEISLLIIRFMKPVERA